MNDREKLRIALANMEAAEGIRAAEALRYAALRRVMEKHAGEFVRVARAAGTISSDIPQMGEVLALDVLACYGQWLNDDTDDLAYL
jgi:NADPH-dependent curcumin reductase CurA